MSIMFGIANCCYGGLGPYKTSEYYSSFNACQSEKPKTLPSVSVPCRQEEKTKKETGRDKVLTVDQQLRIARLIGTIEGATCSLDVASGETIDQAAGKIAEIIAECEDWEVYE